MVLTEAQLVRREAQTSQRSFRIRKYGRSISRGSDASKLSNRSQGHVNRGTEDIAQKTIEQPTDVEDADDGL